MLSLYSYCFCTVKYCIVFTIESKVGGKGPFIYSGIHFWGRGISHFIAQLPRATCTVEPASQPGLSRVHQFWLMRTKQDNIHEPSQPRTALICRHPHRRGRSLITACWPLPFYLKERAVVKTQHTYGRRDGWTGILTDMQLYKDRCPKFSLY